MKESKLKSFVLKYQEKLVVCGACKDVDEATKFINEVIEQANIIKLSDHELSTSLACFTHTIDDGKLGYDETKYLGEHFPWLYEKAATRLA